MKTDRIFTEWCIQVVPRQIMYLMAGAEEEGVTFTGGTKTQIQIKGVDPLISFELPLPDQICWDDGSGPLSKEALDHWVGIVSEHIFKLWDQSYNGKKHKLLDDLKSFSIIYPKMAQDLLNAVIFRDGNFEFDITKTAYGEISLMVAKFDDFVSKRTYNVPKIQP
jgi:hypothetical protein